MLFTCLFYYSEVQLIYYWITSEVGVCWCRMCCFVNYFLAEWCWTWTLHCISLTVSGVVVSYAMQHSCWSGYAHNECFAVLEYMEVFFERMFLFYVCYLSSIEALQRERTKFLTFLQQHLYVFCYVVCLIGRKPVVWIAFPVLEQQMCWSSLLMFAVWRLN